MNKLKDKLKDVKDTIPFILNLTTENIKKNFQEQGPEIFDNLNGALGIAVRLFGSSLINKYFAQASESKLSNFGIQIYLKAACEQAEESLKEIDRIELNINSRKEIIEKFDSAFEEIKQNTIGSDLIISFSPRKHPLVVVVRQTCEKVIKEYLKESNEELISSFNKNFNENISVRVENLFGDDYQVHQDQVDLEWYKSAKGKLLNEMINLHHIGFTESENLKYQETFGQWAKVEDYRNPQEIFDEEEIEDIENNLVSIDSLYNKYFDDQIEPIEKVLFILADFGKGKSIYLKQKASKIAKRYEQNGEGPIPVYFNLREFDEYDQGSSFGVLSDYLGKKFGIEVQEEEFQSNEFYFFIDSLDECGNLTEEKVDKVISSIKKIQLISPKKCRKNRIVVTSRPIEYGLIKHLNANKPYIIKNEENRPVNYYISVYGFKKEQFNDSVIDSLQRLDIASSEEYEGLSKKIIDSIIDGSPIDIYAEFTEASLLTHSELTRPIFAYILYKLILNKVDLSNTNKVGIYLSFINLLTKEAKYINSSRKVNLKDEYRFRNILHSTAALWMYESHQSNQGFLKKEDISNTIEGSKIDRKDDSKLIKYEEIENIEFLSQSYFGQKGNTFYFQHQSFAEILLAEYYLKVFLKFALDPSSKIEDIRVKFFLGNPTEQTIDFLRGLLILLKESVSDQITTEIINRRKLLFPMLASLCTLDFSKQLYSQYLSFKWFDICEITDNNVEPPQELLEKWCITQEVLNKVITLAKNIVISKENYLLIKSSGSQSSLFNNEVIQLNQNINTTPPDIDKWLSLLVGNVLYNKSEGKEFFINKINDFKVVVELFQNWSFFSKSATPTWARTFFIGIKLRYENHEIESSLSSFLSSNVFVYNFENIIFYGIDFSYSEFKNVFFDKCNFLSCNFFESQIIDSGFTSCKIEWTIFDTSLFKNTRFEFCNLHRSSFVEIAADELSLELCEIAHGIPFPSNLNQELSDFYDWFSDYTDKTYLSSKLIDDETYFLNEIIEESVAPLIKIALKGKGINLSIIKKWFLFENEEYAEKLLKIVKKEM